MQRKYQELYDAMKKLEAKGRRWCKLYAPILGALLFLIGLYLANQISEFLYRTEDPRTPRPPLPSELAIGIFLGVGALAFATAYQYGRRLVLEAQRTLVLVDTEQNTAEIVELLRHEQKLKAKGEIESSAEPAQPSKTPV